MMSQPKPKVTPPSALKSATTPFEARKFDFSKIKGLSERALEIHRSLYEGYVKECNALLPFVYTGSTADETSPAERLTYDGLVRRLAFERNGMVLHELFFDALRGECAPPRPNGNFLGIVTRSYGSYQAWRANVRKLAQTRGVGWVASVLSDQGNRLSNLWIDEHAHGVLADWQPVMLFDLWEHAFLLDFKPSERLPYLDVLFDNTDWEVVEQRCG